MRSKLFLLILIGTVVVSMTLLGTSFVGCKKAEEAKAEEEAAPAEEEAAPAEEEAAPAEEEAAPAEEETVIVVGVINDHMSMDQYSDNSSYKVKQLMYNGLTECKFNNEIIPGLAESWEISDDLKEYTFYLRKGVLFHNGREFVADDVKKSLEWAASPECGCYFSGNISYIEDIKVIDDYTVKITLNKKDASFLSNVSTGQKPIVAMEQYDDDMSVDIPIGTGPYKFVEWVRDDHFTIEKFEDFWGGDVNVDKFIFKPITDPIVMATALKTGDIDVATSIESDDVILYQNNPSDDYVFTISEDAVYYARAFTMNCTRPPFNDLRVRQAIAYAVDKEAVREGLFKGLGQPIASIYPTGYWSTPDAYVYPYDPEKAKELLAEAGYPDGFKTTIVACAPWKPSVELAILLQPYLAEIGVNMDILAMAVSDYCDCVGLVDFDMHSVSNTIGTNLGNSYQALVETGCVYPGLFGLCTSTRVDELLALAREEIDDSKKKEYYDEVADILGREVAIVWVAAQMQTFGYRSNIEGIEYNINAEYIYEINKGYPQIVKK